MALLLGALGCILLGISTLLDGKRNWPYSTLTAEYIPTARDKNIGWIFIALAVIQIATLCIMN